MKKKLVSRLRLNRETLRSLTEGRLSDVAGGAVTRAFTGCEHCSMAGGTACLEPHTNYTEQASCPAC